METGIHTTEFRRKNLFVEKYKGIPNPWFAQLNWKRKIIQHTCRPIKGKFSPEPGLWGLGVSCAKAALQPPNNSKTWHRKGALCQLLGGCAPRHQGRAHTGNRSSKWGQAAGTARGWELRYLSGTRAAAPSPGGPSQGHTCLVCLSARQTCLQSPLHNLWSFQKTLLKFVAASCI